MNVRGLKTLRRSAAWIRSRLVPGAVVLGYHRIAEAASDPYGLCVSPRNFEEQLDVVRALARPQPLDLLVEQATRGALPKRALAVTFDDGYSDFVDTALPRLCNREIPATLFVVTGTRGAPFWWDRLSEGAARMNGAHSTEEFKRALDSDLRRLRVLSPGDRMSLLSSLEAEHPSTAAKLPHALSTDDLISLAADRLVDIGGHTRSHGWLPDLSVEEQRFEIEGCRNDLQEITGRTISGFSFPFGGTTPGLRRIVSDAGFVYACDSHTGLLVSSGDGYGIPRLWAPNLNGDFFARWLRRWLHA